MPKLWLFGVELTLTPAANETFVYSGSLGGAKNKVAATLSKGVAPNEFALDLSFDGDNPGGGEVPQGWAKFAGRFKCGVEPDDRVQILSVISTSVTPMVSVRMPLGLGDLSLQSPEIVAGLNYDLKEEGVGFQDISVASVLQTLKIAEALPNTKWTSSNKWTRFFVSFNFTLLPSAPFKDAAHVVFKPREKRPDRYELLLLDQFLDLETETGPGKEQLLNISAARASSSEVRVFFYPQEHALLVHPDILDTKDALKEGNDILYQYALANGFFEFVARKDAADFAYRTRWQKAHNGQPGTSALVMFRLQDEHGNPLIVEAPYFPLITRAGIQNPPDISQREKTIQGVVIQAENAQETEDLSLGKLPLKSINPVSLFNSKTERSFDWLDDKGKIVTGKPPTEVHGLCKGAYLELRAAADKVNCGLATVSVTDANKENIFTQTELMVEVGSWQLVSQMEERETYPAVSDTPVTPVGLRKAEPKNAQSKQPLRLPAIDTSYALANLVGELHEEATLAKSGHEWLTRLDDQFTKVDDVAKGLFKALKNEIQTHTSGFEIDPPTASIPNSIIDLPPGIAESAEATARTGVALASELNRYVHGGERKKELVKELGDAISSKVAEQFELKASMFAAFWNSPDVAGELAAARLELRKFLAGDRILADLTDDYFKEALARAREVISSDREIEGVKKRFQELKGVVSGINEATLKQWWRKPSDIPAAQRELILALLDYLWAPGAAALYRRALATVWTAAASELPPDLVKYLSLLKGQVQLFTDTVKQYEDYIKDTLPGFLTAAQKGVDDYYRLLVEVWEKGSKDWLEAEKQRWEQLRKLYGISFTPDVYERLLKKEDLSKEVLGLFNKATGLSLKRLSDLKSEPPAYFFYTKRFPVAENQKSPETGWLWRKAFELCRFGADKAWKFFLDEDCSIILKLTGARDLPDIIREIHRSYKSKDRPNPLGFVSKDGDGDKAVEEFITKRLHPDMHARSWRGVLILNPVGDISEDRRLRDLCGFEHINITYAAVGGAKPQADAAQNAPALDIYANIFQQAPEPAATPGGDVSLTLLKFDVTIKHTQIEAGEIVFLLNLQNLWGQDGKKYNPIYIRGTLARETKTEGKENSPSSFEFAAWFETPYEAPINIAFIKSFKFRGVRIGTNKGQTCIDIDGDLMLQKWQSIDFFDGMEAPYLALQNFRILLPTLPKGALQRIGLPRALNFDFPSISFTLPNPRVMHWGGIEFKPIQIGFVRGITKALDELREQYNWLSGYEWPGAGLSFAFPYMRFEVDFGKLPSFGSSDLSGLKFDLVLGLQLPEKKIRLGLAGLKAKEIKIDLFRLLSLHIEGLELGRFKAFIEGDPPAQQQDVMAVKANNVQLKILDWSPLPEGSKLQFLLAHLDTKNDPNKKVEAALGFYSQKASGGDSFFKLHWVLLAHNIVVDPKILNYLLFDKGKHGEAVDLMERLVTDSRIHGRLVSEEQWLFGISFELKDFIDRCRLILHDQHYYGISLKAEKIKWFQALFGEDGLTLAYIPGPTRDRDRFRTSFRIAALDLLGFMRSGDLALEWAVNWDYLIDFGFPWRGSAGYDWFRAFSIPTGTYEAKFGFYFEKRTELVGGGKKELTISAGVGFYLGYYFGFSSSIVWLRAGIGVFAILEGTVVFEQPAEGGIGNLLKTSIKSISVTGVIGIFAYGEGGIDVWVLSARFRVQVQAAIAGTLNYVRGGSSALTYAANLSASYSASCRVGSGWFSFTFRVSGSVNIGVSGRVLLN